MRIVRRAAELDPGARRVCVAIGVFDGVHLGHQQVIRQTQADAHQHEGLAVVVTFDQHPNVVVAPDRAPPMIHALAQKLRVIESLGVDATLLIAFDPPFSEVRAVDFVQGLARDFRRLVSVCVGSGFTFGYKREGNLAMLHSLGRELGFTVHGLAAVALDGEAVSSTRIREAIGAGDFDAASQLLGRAYSLWGKVGRGEGIGRQLGFPTANLDTTGLVLPPAGVYAVHVRVGRREYRAVLNLGYRPTLLRPQPLLQAEAHLLDFSGDLYGRELEVTWVTRLRDEQRFPSAVALQRQIEQDILAARGVF